MSLDWPRSPSEVVDQQPAVGEREALALRPGGQEQRPIDIAIPTHIVAMSGLRTASCL